METALTTSRHAEEAKNPAEIENGNKCTPLIQKWVNEPYFSSVFVIKSLHETLMHNSDSYSSKGVGELQPGNFRKEDIDVKKNGRHLYARFGDVIPLMSRYGQDLDKLLRNLPETPHGNVEKIISDASWAYYTFIRIHPFLDGNGRTGRMIIQRVLKGAGFNKSLIYEEQSWRQQGREPHLDALDKVNDTGSLTPLEIYLISQLLPEYTQDSNLTHELEDALKNKREEYDAIQPRSISAIWKDFENIDIYGVSDVTDAVA